MNQDDYIFYLIIALVFFTIVLMIAGFYSLWNIYKSPEAIRINDRLAKINETWSDNKKTTLIKKRLLSESIVLDSQLKKIPYIHKLDRILLQSGLELSVSNFLFYSILFALIGCIISVIFELKFIYIMIFSLLMGLLPILYVMRKRSDYLNKMEVQLPEAIDLMARALKAGHAFSGALQMVGTEGMEPIALEFRTTFDEINYGVPMQEALIHLTVRVPITDLRYFVIAVMIQRESGGNLAELLESISSLIRARLKLLGTIRVLSAEGKLSAWILGCLPFALALMIQLANPGYLDILFIDPIGTTLMSIMLIVMIVGVYIMRRIIKIRV